ncbi:MAG: hypothetical protein LQ346_001651 [Caloplaca aetnensis]|nr:MAG: hypothetical protein LQ346_001651 [Caloplaca aetnensis]
MQHAAQTTHLRLNPAWMEASEKFFRPQPLKKPGSIIVVDVTDSDCKIDPSTKTRFNRHNVNVAIAFIIHLHKADALRLHTLSGWRDKHDVEARGVQVSNPLPYLITKIEYCVKNGFSVKVAGQKYVDETYDTGKPPPIVRAPGEEGKEDSKSQADKEDDRWGFEDDEKKGDEGSTSSNDTDDGEPPVAWAKPTKGEKKDRKAAKQKATDPFSNAGAVEGDLSSAVGDWRKKLFVPQGDYQ